MISHRPLRALLAALCAATALAGCANSNSATSTAPSGLAGHAQGAGPAPQASVAEPPPEVPPGPPSASYAYRGGRDPLTGHAAIVEGASEPLTLGPDGNPIAPKAAGKSPAKPLQRAGKAPAQSGGSVIVQKGDSLFRIAQRHRVTVNALMAANNLSGPNIVPGQRLVLPR